MWYLTIVARKSTTPSHTRHGFHYACLDKEPQSNVLFLVTWFEP